MKYYVFETRAEAVAADQAIFEALDMDNAPALIGGKPTKRKNIVRPTRWAKPQKRKDGKWVIPVPVFESKDKRRPLKKLRRAGETAVWPKERQKGKGKWVIDPPDFTSPITSREEDLSDDWFDGVDEEE